jgi:alpha-glucosidase (family GH31 glycosyl hydrolase)
MRAAMALGADGWMNDFAEWLPTDSINAAGSGMGRHNRYPVLWQEVAREAIDGAPDGRSDRLFFGRSGWLGTPALADVIWAGDQRTTMDVDDGLPTIVPIGIGLGITGISTYGHDIAGYQSGTNPGSSKETYLRWTELGAWSPVMRTHHGSKPNGNWVWWSDAETTEQFRRYAKLHMALVPYMEGLAKVASETGLPIWRGLALAYPEDAAVWPIKDQVLVGDGLLVAPVVTEGETKRDVYFPAGRFYPWDSGEPVVGPTTASIDAPLTEIPVFAAEGAVVPMFPDGVMTLVNGSPEVPDASSVGDDRVVRVFLGKSGTFSEAGGLGYKLEQLAPGAPTSPSFTWEGAPLAACAQPAVAPCVLVSAGRAEAHVTGPGTLEVLEAGAPSARFVASGGDAARALQLIVRW